MSHPTLTCECICCADGVARSLTGRLPVDGCRCDLYPSEQQCDCAFCLEAIVDPTRMSLLGITTEDNKCPECGGTRAGHAQTPWKTNPCESCDGTGDRVEGQWCTNHSAYRGHDGANTGCRITNHRLPLGITTEDDDGK